MYKSFYQNSFPTHDNHNIYSVYLGIRYTSSIYQWEFQDPKLEVPTICRLIFQAENSGDIPTIYGQNMVLS